MSGDEYAKSVSWTKGAYMKARVCLVLLGRGTAAKIKKGEAEAGHHFGK
jgi:hypothetical protein